MEETTVELVKQFGEKIEMYGSNLFEIAMKQQIVEITQGCLGILMNLLFLGIAVVCYKAACKHIKANSEISDGEQVIWICVTHFVLGTILLITIQCVVTYLFVMIQWYLNPEYQAALEITKLVGAMT